MLRPLWAVCIVCCAVASASAGAQDQPFTFTVKSHLVALPVTVRDSKGALVQSLHKEDFQLFEDGIPQTIRYLDLDTDRPLTVGLLVDESRSMKNFVRKEHDASDVFFNAMLQKKEDTAFLVRFDDAVMMLQSATNSRADLHAALGKLEERHGPARAFKVAPDDKTSILKPFGGTLLYDSVVVVCDTVTKRLPGRKALVILTDGEDSGSQKSLPAAIEAAQQSDTIIYTILYTRRDTIKDPEAARLASQKAIVSGQDVLQWLSSTTGGHEYEVSSTLPLEAIYANIAEELRMQYTMAYAPVKSGAGPGYRKIEVKSKDKGLQIQTRFGYYAQE